MIWKLLPLTALALGVGFAPCFGQAPVDCTKPAPTDPTERKAWEKKCGTVPLYLLYMGDSSGVGGGGPQMVALQDSSGIGGGGPQMKIMKAMLNLGAFDLSGCRTGTSAHAGERIMTCSRRVELVLTLGPAAAKGNGPVISLPRH
jgi:hypothetical protein